MEENAISVASSVASNGGLVRYCWKEKKKQRLFEDRLVLFRIFLSLFVILISGSPIMVG